ncbi:MAG TPA: PIN domain-containing protein [Polyangia bacterium]|nr:PIN domain-containing protein [Polyangia bacterium]
MRLVVRDDARQLAVAQAFVAGGVWVSHLVLAETAWALQANYDFDAAALIDALEMLLNHVRLTVQDSDAAAAALVEFRKYPAVGFSDCLILEATRKAGHLPLGTFDRPLARLQGVHEL